MSSVYRVSQVATDQIIDHAADQNDGQERWFPPEIEGQAAKQKNPVLNGERVLYGERGEVIQQQRCRKECKEEEERAKHHSD